MFYYLQENNTAGVNAGTKARNDVEKILFQINIFCIILKLLIFSKVAYFEMRAAQIIFYIYLKFILILMLLLFPHRYPKLLSLYLRILRLCK